MAWLAAAAVGVLVSAAAWGQTVDIYSEFHRLSPFGVVVAPDRGITRREVLSPAVTRNGHASFHVAVSTPASQSYLLYVVTNPIEACRVSLFREKFVMTREGWIPDSLVEVERLPDFGVMPDSAQPIEGQTTRLYLLDIWVPPDAPVGRFRLEVQLKMADWTIRPMEVRVISARIPEIPRGSGAPPALPPVDAGADASAAQALSDCLAGKPPRFYGSPATVREVIRRNAAQDCALARTAGGPVPLATRFLDVWSPGRIFGAEWYLRMRDFLHSKFAQR
jgi:hypothetical protein